MTDKTISQLTRATAVDDEDLFPLVQSGNTRAITARNLFGGTVSVARFGAVGDSSTNNATAFAAAFAAASAGDTIYFPPAAGTWRTTSPLPIKSGVSVVGEPGTVVEYLSQAVGTMIDDGNTAMTIDFRGLTFRRSGDGTALSGAEGSARYTVRQQHASSVFRFWGCTLDDSNWNITDGATGALIAAICDGTSGFYGCKINGVTGYGVYTNSGTIYFDGEISSATKCFANHGGTVHAHGRFTATDATATGRGTLSIASGTIYVTGDIVRTGDAIAPGIYLAGGTVYGSGTIKSAGIGIQMDNSAAVCNWVGNIYTTASNAITNSSGLCRASGTFTSEQSNGIGISGGTLYLTGTVYAPYTAVGSKNGLQISGGVIYFKGNISASGTGVNVSAGEAWVDAHVDYTAGALNSAVTISGGTLKLGGRIETEVNGIVLSGSTAKTLDIDDLDIRINGSNTARRGISFGASTNNTVRVSSLRIFVPAGATASISTDGGNAQTITAGKVMASVAIGADITVAAFTYAAP